MCIARDAKFLHADKELGSDCADMQVDLSVPIKKTCLYNFDPHKPHFYKVKLRFTGVYIIFLNLLKK